MKLEPEQSAQAILLDQGVITISPETYTELVTRIEKPALSNDRLHALLNTPAPWDQ